LRCIGLLQHCRNFLILPADRPLYVQDRVSVPGSFRPISELLAPSEGLDRVVAIQAELQFRGYSHAYSLAITSSLCRNVKVSLMALPTSDLTVSLATLAEGLSFSAAHTDAVQGRITIKGRLIQDGFSIDAKEVLRNSPELQSSRTNPRRKPLLIAAPWSPSSHEQPRRLSE
jgi:hypothetical protein